MKYFHRNAVSIRKQIAFYSSNLYRTIIMSLAINFNRFLKITVSMKDLAARVQKPQLIHLKRVKKKFERNLARQNSLPAELPRINWDYYFENLGTEHHAMIAEYKEKYKAFQIPMPQDQISPKYDALKAEYNVVVQKYNEESNERIKFYEDALKQYRALMPYEQMTMEDYCNLFPNEAPDYINRPTFWPHTPEEQLGYVKPPYEYVRKPAVHDRKEKVHSKPKELPGSIKGKSSKAKGAAIKAEKHIPPKDGK